MNFQNHNQNNIEQLKKYNLDVYNNAEQIAASIEISIARLHFLAFNSQTSHISHYIHFKTAKKIAGTRIISAPLPDLKRAQYWILHNILQKIAIHNAAHGFCGDRSIITNATPHIGAEVIINIDLQDFFSAITYPRVKGLFQSFGYSSYVATIFGLLCTAPVVEERNVDGEINFVELKQRHLPQGSPASPAITNIICRSLDERLSAIATQFGFTYTRYVDDLTFSASGEQIKHTSSFIKQAQSIISDEGFAINPDKTRILRNSQQQKVTGIIVNQKINISRKKLKSFRATLHQIENEGLEGKYWGKSSNLVASITGFANFVAMVNPEKGAEFQQQIQRIQKKYGKKN
ncbi:RNA-directed DNA polymerase [Nostoc sp. HK-01]|uniref:RNA-directed DNA polymerase n=1 Tax=Nostoc cycadae WK-1 TaxID=1861711 RepID=A0A2H6LBK5_9NOSO|nr:reverse transcriptase family protein [Nostoc cycadae]BBD58103.1 RNA-directed DNA polymerase [Nostoc sp. HK-01]GBE90634.1 RNA-directed DNA polymerase [Nostoc cycadae WK-1]